MLQKSIGEIQNQVYGKQQMRFKLSIHKIGIGQVTVGVVNGLAGSRNLGSALDKSRSLVYSWFVFTFFESRNISPKSLGLGFLTRISASLRVSDFTIRHP